MIANNQAIISIENFNYKNYNSKINSPRSLEACNRLGIDPKDLFFVDFNQYKLSNPEIFALDKEIQKIRWNHLNQLKEKYKGNIGEERKKLIYLQNFDSENILDKFRLSRDFDRNSSHNLFNSSLTKSNNNLNHMRSKSMIPIDKNIIQSLSSSTAFYKPTAIENEIIILNKAKERQKIELQALIQHNLTKHLKKKENEEKSSFLRYRNYESKNTISKTNMIMKRNSQEMNDFEINGNCIKETNNESTLNSKTFSNFQFKNSKLIINNNNNSSGNEKEFVDENEEVISEIHSEKKHQFENNNNNLKKTKLNFVETKKKFEEFRNLCEKQLQEEKIKAEIKKKKMEEKEKERLEQMEKKRIEKIKENEKIRILHKQRYENEKQKIYERLKKEAETMTEKQIRSDFKRQQLDELRKMVFKKKGEEMQKKQEEIQKYFEKEKEKDENKNIELEKKMLEIENHKKLIDKMKEEEIKMRLNELKLKEKKSCKTREIKEKLDTNKREGVFVKINQVYYKVKVKKEMKERELMFKNEKNSLKRSETIMNLKRIENMKEYETNKKREVIDEKYRRSMEFKEQKSFIMTQKRFLSVDTSNKRQVVLNKFDEIDKNPIIEEAIKEIFPDDPKFIEKIQIIRENSYNQSIQSKFGRNSMNIGKRFSKTKNSESQIIDENKYFNAESKSNFYFTDTRFSKSKSNLSKAWKSEIPKFSVDSLKISPEIKFRNQENLHSDENNKNDNYPLNIRENIETNSNKQKINKKMIKSNDEDINVQNGKVSEFHCDKEKKIKKNNDNGNCINITNKYKLNNNNLEKFNMNNIKNNLFTYNNYLSNNLNIYSGFNGKCKNNNSYNKKFFINSNIGNYNSNNLENNNQKIKIKISNKLPETFMNKNNILNEKKDSISNSFNGENGNNINININNKITNFYDMSNYISCLDEKLKIRNNITEDEIEQKINVYKSKLNSEMIKLLNEEKIKESIRQTLYENIEDIKEKKNLEKDITKERMQSSERIIKMNKEIEQKLKEYEKVLRSKIPQE